VRDEATAAEIVTAFQQWKAIALVVGLERAGRARMSAVGDVEAAPPPEVASPACRCSPISTPSTLNTNAAATSTAASMATGV
jgi:hypothetical protein